MSVHVKSLVKSGLISGLIINVSAIAMVPMVGDQMDTILAKQGLPPLSIPDMLFFSCVSFIMGFFLVWLYTLVKVELGPGSRTAILVSVIVWFMTYFLSNVSLVVYGFMPIGLTLIGTVWGLVELVIASLIGARLYKDEQQPSY